MKKELILAISGLIIFVSVFSLILPEQSFLILISIIIGIALVAILYLIFQRLEESNVGA